MSAASRASAAPGLRARIEGWFIPPAIAARGGEALLRARLLLLVVLGGSLSTIVGAILDLRAGASGVGWLAIALVSPALAAPFVLRRTGSLALAGNLVVGVLFSLVFVSGVLMLGRGPAVLFLFLVPAFAIVFCRRRAALTWSFATVVALVVMAALAASPLRDVVETPHGSAVLRLHRIAFFSLLVSVVCLLTYDALKARALSDLEDANRALTESREQFRRLVETCPDAVFVSRDGRVLYANSRAVELLGAPNEQAIVGTAAATFLELTEEQIANARSSVFSGRRVSDMRLTLRTLSGESIPVEASASATQYDGEPALISILRDRREQERTLARLRLLGTVVEQAHEGVIVIDAGGVVQFVNDAYARNRGRPAEDFIGIPVRDLPRDAPGRQFVRDVRQRLASPDGSVSGVFSIEGEEGRRNWDMRIFRVQTEDPRGPALVTLLRDVSREVELEQRARQSQKMEAVGQLAGGIAHDFNNHLTVILGHAEELREMLVGDAGALAEVDAVVEAAERSAALTQQLLAFARRQAVDARVLDVSEVVRGMEEMVRRLLPERIELRVDLAPDAPPVLGDRGQIEQIVLNLVLNARDAIEATGHINVSTGGGALPEALRESQGGERWAVLRVVDDGQGMDETTRGRIFEPFFTTKPAGRGTGLGLSTVHGIVYQSGGAIGVDSRPGAGTAVSVYLPCAEGAAPAAEQAAAQPRLEEALGGTVLVVEDERSIRAIARRALQAAGFEVVVAEGGAEALAVAAGRKLDLLISDIVMPGMSGLELADRLTALHPEVPVLFISGYSEDAIEHRRARGAGRELLAKPFRPQQLVERARRIIDARRSGG